MDINV
jgi:hypothetical protein